MITVQDPGRREYLRAVGISGLIGCGVGVAIAVALLVNNPGNGPGPGIWVVLVIGAFAVAGSLIGLAVYRPYRYTVDGDYLSRVRYALEMTPVRQITAVAWVGRGALHGVRITSTSLNGTLTVREGTQPLLLALGESLTRTNRADTTVHDDDTRRALGLSPTVPGPSSIDDGARRGLAAVTQDANPGLLPGQQDTTVDRQVAPPGWYRHPTGSMTWWDGTRWVEPFHGQKPDPTWSIFSHLSWFVLPILCPLLVRVIRGRRDPYSRHHSTEALNAHLTFVILLLALIGSVVLTAAIDTGSALDLLMLVVTVIGAVATVAWSVFSVTGAVQASRGNWWRHPTSIRLVPGAMKTPPGGQSATLPPPGSPRPDGPPPPPDGPAVPTDHPTTSPSTSTSKRTVVVLVATLIVFVAVSSVVWSMTIGSVSVTAPEVKVGDCFTELPDAAQGVPVPRSISCQESHAGEVVAVLTMPDGDFPGQTAIDAYAEDKCVAALADYSPQAMLDDSIQLFGRYPTVESWTQGDRGVLCVATLRPPRTGSIKG